MPHSACGTGSTRAGPGACYSVKGEGMKRGGRWLALEGDQLILNFPLPLLFMRACARCMCVHHRSGSSKGRDQRVIGTYDRRFRHPTPFPSSFFSPPRSHRSHLHSPPHTQALSHQEGEASQGPATMPPSSRPKPSAKLGLLEVRSWTFYCIAPHAPFGERPLLAAVCVCVLR